MKASEFAQQMVDMLHYVLASSPSRQDPRETVDLFLATKLHRLSEAVLLLCNNQERPAAEIVLRSIFEHWVEMRYIQLQGEEAARIFLASAPAQQEDFIRRARKIPVDRFDTDALGALEETARQEADESAEWAGVDRSELTKRMGFEKKAKLVRESAEVSRFGAIIMNTMGQLWIHYSKRAHPSSVDLVDYLETTNIGLRTRRDSVRCPDNVGETEAIALSVAIIAFETATNLNERLALGAGPQLRGLADELGLAADEAGV